MEENPALHQRLVADGNLTTHRAVRGSCTANTLTRTSIVFSQNMMSEAGTVIMLLALP